MEDYQYMTRAELVEMAKNHPATKFSEFRKWRPSNKKKSEIIQSLILFDEALKKRQEREKENQEREEHLGRVEDKYKVRDSYKVIYEQEPFSEDVGIIKSAVNTLFNDLAKIEKWGQCLLAIQSQYQALEALKKAKGSDPDVTDDVIAYYERVFSRLIRSIKNLHIETSFQLSSWEVRNFVEKKTQNP